MARRMREIDSGAMLCAVRLKVELCRSQCDKCDGHSVLRVVDAEGGIFQTRKGDLVRAAALLGWIDATQQSDIQSVLPPEQGQYIGHIRLFRDAAMASGQSQESFQQFCA